MFYADATECNFLASRIMCVFTHLQEFYDISRQNALPQLRTYVVCIYNFLSGLCLSFFSLCIKSPVKTREGGESRQRKLDWNTSQAISFFRMPSSLLTCFNITCAKLV